MQKRLVLVTLAVLVLGCLTLAQAPTLVLSIDQVMTIQEQRDTGISTLSPSQRSALDEWLNRYTQNVLRAVSNSGSIGRYAGVGTGHWISEVSGNGAYIKLEDDSMWEINEIDRIDTAIWLPVSNITVIVSKRPVGDFKYELINTDDGEKALAQFMVKH
jgi:hypothetical protein